MQLWIRIIAVGFAAFTILAAPARAEGLDESIDGYLAQADAPKAQASPWKTDGGLGLTYRDGNSDVTNFYFGLNTEREWTKSLLKFRFQGIYSRDSGTETASEWIMVQRYQYKLSERSRLWQQLWVETDSQESLALRLVLTGGYGYRFMKTKDDKFVWWGEIGAGYSTDNFYGGEDNNEAILQLNTDWDWQITKTLNYKQVIQLWPSLTNGGEFKLIWASTFSLPVSERWDFKLIIQDQYNSDPVEGNENNDFTLVFAINFKFNQPKEA
ncbi:MAG: DUF481 domain-containing protein [Planctomycetota bacterium]|jgi:putative salt-induced outer membrane protein